MAVRQTLVGLDAPTLQAIQTACTQAIISGCGRGVSYGIAGRTFSFPSLESAQNTLQEAANALGMLTGDRADVQVCNFNPSFNRR